MFPGFTDIGARLGPFDVTMIESGAYNAMWADVHLGPEQAVQAHSMVRGKVMIPVHWGLFDLALHSWMEPIEHVLAAAQDRGVTVVTPQPGASVEPGVLLRQPVGGHRHRGRRRQKRPSSRPTCRPPQVRRRDPIQDGAVSPVAGAWLTRAPRSRRTACKSMPRSLV